MKYKTFCVEMIKLSSDSDERIPEDDELKYMYDRYLNASLKIDSTILARRFISFKKFDTKQRLGYRDKCATEGIEFTPDQINFYINMLAIVGTEYLGKWYDP